jgi:hypothetical protein
MDVLALGANGHIAPTATDLWGFHLKEDSDPFAVSPSAVNGGVMLFLCCLAGRQDPKRNIQCQLAGSFERGGRLYRDGDGIDYAIVTRLADDDCNMPITEALPVTDEQVMLIKPTVALMVLPIKPLWGGL